MVALELGVNHVTGGLWVNIEGEGFIMVVRGGVNNGGAGVRG